MITGIVVTFIVTTLFLALFLGSLFGGFAVMISMIDKANDTWDSPKYPWLYRFGGLVIMCAVIAMWVTFFYWFIDL